jgi:hypothetical protein
MNSQTRAVYWKRSAVAFCCLLLSRLPFPTMKSLHLLPLLFAILATVQAQTQTYQYDGYVDTARFTYENGIAARTGVEPVHQP